MLGTRAGIGCFIILPWIVDIWLAGIVIVVEFPTVLLEVIYLSEGS